MHDWSWGMGGMIFGPLFMIIWLAILVAAIVFVLRYLGVLPGAGDGAGRTARDILDERFARGEIDREEYDQRRKALGA